MAFQPAVCSQCGGRIKVDDVDLNGFATCEFCGTSHKIIDIITVEGLPTAKTYLDNANRAMEDGQTDSAMKYFKKVLEIKPNCHEAFWGMYLCQSAIDKYYGYKDKYGNKGPLVRAQLMSDALNKYAYRAIQYAPNDIAAYYRGKISADENYVSKARGGTFDKKQTSLTGKKQSGCYIATCVYGSYDCDEVFQLRRFRDEKLSTTPIGRFLISLYYTLSPSMIKHIQRDSFLEDNIRVFLDWFRKRFCGDDSDRNSL